MTITVITTIIFFLMTKSLLANQDQQITAVIVNRKENLLKKGGGYHLDLLVVAIGIIVNSLLGIPWSTFFSENSPMSIRKTFSTL